MTAGRYAKATHWNGIPIREIYERYLAGETLTYLSIVANRARSTMINHFARQGWPLSKDLGKKRPRRREAEVYGKLTIDEIVEMLQAKVKPSVIAERAGVRRGLIYNVARRHEIDWGKRISNCKAKLPEIVGYYQAGFNTARISTLVGLTTTQIYRLMFKAGISIRQIQHKRRQAKTAA